MKERINILQEFSVPLIAGVLLALVCAQASHCKRQDISDVQK